MSYSDLNQNQKILSDGLYSMKLGDHHKMDWFDVIRVPGGWIFHSHQEMSEATVFVPFNNEYQHSDFRKEKS